jgi:4-amino-4-deoxy-L-arabinose transferase-like glycosyltransferase
MLRTGDWLTFRIAGEPFFDKGPLFMWVAAAFAKALGGILPVHDAARLASGFFMACTLGLVSLASLELIGERAVRLGVLLFIGCLGILIRAHEMSTAVAGLTGVALGFYGVALAARRPKVGGLLAGVGIATAFLGNGFLPAGMLLGFIALLPASGAFWRTRAFGLTVAIALATALPLLAAWPLALASSAPVWWQVWLDTAAASRWSDPFNRGEVLEIFHFVRILPWYAWPAWPLAAWTLWRARRTVLGRRDLLLPLIAFVAFFVVTSVFGEAREVNAMAMLLPLSILGVAELDTLPRGAASALDWFGVTTFFLFAAMLWVGWFAAMTGSPDIAAAWLAREVPGYRYKFSYGACALAALLTLVWLVVVARSLRSTRRALVNWAAGITMVWMLAMTLGLPLIDQARSYRPVASSIAAALPRNFRCIARLNVGDAQRALLDYFAGINTIRVEYPAASRCNALLVQAPPTGIPAVGSEWFETWRGSRPGDHNELFILYLRQAASR